MGKLLALSRGIDAVTAFIGRRVAWLILVAVLVSAVNASIRKAFDMSSNAWLELQWYLYGTVFLLAAAYTLQKNEHVRIDFISNMLTKKTRDWIDLLGHIFFLLPFAGLILYLSIPWFLKSYHSGEISGSAGGLVLWPAKIMVVIGFGLLLAQAFSEIIKRIGVIRGHIDEPYAGHDSPPAVDEAASGYAKGERP
ncbi:TRAP transporter small permease subunit [Mariluticola halotolerans]|uniref:TRAP transporter small permease subunit n=1 Tax=Mariluticola halotolerans TaxID=2909283 RepID=UPI0026E3E9A8|nr:TRAP transporter small permease subunit [Mariluticola halotolerans]UJQ93921.1 TRAP transporter small permease subunit [Mariluticola halotolerans]